MSEISAARYRAGEALRSSSSTASPRPGAAGCRCSPSSWRSILPLEHHAARFREEIPGVEFRSFTRTGHTPMYDDPTLIATTIRDFALAADRRAVPA